MKHARLAHEMYKVLSHFKYDISDEHSGVIPQNCTPGNAFIWVPIHHYGHMTKKLREEKRQKSGRGGNAYVTKDSAICGFHLAHLLFLLLPWQEECI